MKTAIRTMGLVLSVFGAVSACSNWKGPFVTETIDGDIVLDTLFSSAAGAGPVLVRVNGNPFGGDDRALETAMHAALADAVIGRVVTFTSDAKKSPQPQNNITVVFNPPLSADGTEWCRGAHLPPPAPMADGRLDVRMVFCASKERLGEAEGMVRDISGLSDRRFHALFFDLANLLLVQRNPDGPCASGDEDC